MSLASPSTTSVTPITTPTPASEATLYHLLSLPPLLQPLSPSHAALHLARIRLLLSIPTDKQLSPSEISLPVESTEAAVGKATLGAWCHQCGGLRKGAGGAEPRLVAGPKAPGKMDKVNSIRERARKRHRDNARLSEDEKEEKRMERKLEIGGVLELQKTKRLPAECTTCGGAYTRPRPNRKTLSEFPSARRTRRQAAEDKLENEAALEAVNGKTELKEPASKAPLLSHPPYSHISSSSPNLPSHPPLPPPKSFTTPAPAGGVNSEATKKKRKVKKSGLSKLLAENKERAEAAKGAGMWGL